MSFETRDAAPAAGRFAPSRRTVLGGLASAAILPATAFAQAYPERIIKIICPFPAGSATDTEARFLADRVGAALKGKFIVENKAGANGNLAATEVARAEPDGYTLLLATNSSHSANVHLYKSLNFDPVKDFAPVARLTRNPLVLVVNANNPAKDLRALLEVARQTPGKLTYGTGNTGSHAAAQMMMSMGKFEATRVPYQGTPAAITDLLGGRIDFVITDVAVVRSHVQAGTLRALAVSTPQALTTMPGVPTMAAAGLEGYAFAAWSGLFAPAKTPPAIVETLSKAFVAAIHGPEADRFFDSVGLEPHPGDAAALAAHVAEQTQLWGRLIAETGLEKL